MPHRPDRQSVGAVCKILLVDGVRPAIAHDRDTLTGVAASAETIGFCVVAWEIVALVARAPHDRMLLASRFGVLLSTFLEEGDTVDAGTVSRIAQEIRAEIGEAPLSRKREADVEIDSQPMPLDGGHGTPVSITQGLEPLPAGATCCGQNSRAGWGFTTTST